MTEKYDACVKRAATTGAMPDWSGGGTPLTGDKRGYGDTDPANLPYVRLGGQIGRPPGPAAAGAANTGAAGAGAGVANTGAGAAGAGAGVANTGAGAAGKGAGVANTGAGAAGAGAGSQGTGAAARPRRARQGSGSCLARRAWPRTMSQR